VDGDRFVWLDNDEDEVRARCSCGWLGPWRDRLPDVRADERGHRCAGEEAS
jgi:hypothetical protein